VDEAGTLRGFGLGLTISKAIINAFGGSISAESELGKGTTIHIRLPQA
jgi:signal transduction histidine kinase